MYRTETITVTPEIAREWLDHVPDRQRRVVASRAQLMAQQMNDGVFTRSPQPFIFDTNGGLIDGQHRCHAICLAQVPLESAVVVRDVEPEMFSLIDTGMKRTAAQFIEGRNGSMIAAAARQLRMYERDTEMRDPQSRMNQQVMSDVLETVDLHPGLISLAGEIAVIQKDTRINGGTLLAVTYLGGATYAELLSEWLSGLQTGAGLDLGDARLTLRNTWAKNYRVLNMGSNQRTRWAYVVKAWNAYVDDAPIKLLRFQTTAGTERMPIIR